MPPALARRLREARVDAGLSKRALARRVGISRTYLIDLELGRRAPSARTVLLLAAALNLPDDLERELLAAAAPSRRQLRSMPLHAVVRVPGPHTWPRRRLRSLLRKIVWRLRRPAELAFLRVVARLQRRGGWELSAWVAAFTTRRMPRPKRRPAGRTREPAEKSGLMRE